MEQQLKENIKDTNQWIRIAQMALFVFILYFAMMVVGGVIMLQLLFALITGSDNQNLRQFAVALSHFINQILLFLTYNTDDKPFPFKGWGEETNAANTVEKVVEGVAMAEAAETKTDKE